MTRATPTIREPRVVLFDLDDTLVVTAKVKWAHHKAVARRFYDIELTDAELRLHWGRPFDAMIRALYRDSDTLERMREANLSLEEDFLKQPLPGAVDVIHELWRRGIEVGVVTSTNRSSALRDIERIGLRTDRLTLLQGADDSRFHKPDPRVFDSVLATLGERGVGVDDIWYVGDALIDHTAATGAKLRFVGVSTGFCTRETFARAGAEHILDDIRQLPTLLP
ncbi:HAD family hydrolase [Streptomyces mobaraensis]|uniref:HAD family hydrolase n=1 Tax=Streptomyces mobaraensis TaxID=35621 RepID=UPI001CCBD614|nr:HAD family hydrolase [Streptomyces mobaraensis]UBI40287.1 HAD family hydrolase [Streptomyces mobaraensis]